MLSDYQSLRLSQGPHPATVSKELGLLRAALNQAIQWGWIEFSPFFRFKLKNYDRPKERWISDEEEKKILANAPLWLRDIIVFLLNTAMRSNEALSLRWPEVDLANRVCHVLKPKNHERRTVPLNGTVVDLLRQKIIVRENSGYVFQSAAGTMMDKHNLLKSFKKACTKAGLTGIRVHDLRHTSATRMVRNGIDLFIVSKILGHKDLKMTTRYAHHSITSLRAGVDAIDEKRHKNGTVQGVEEISYSDGFEK
jgi:integrase